MNDLRYKLSDDDRRKIKELWLEGYTNYTHLAIRFNVHPKTIRRVVDDEYRKACNEFNRENWIRFKPSKERHAELMREYRKRKKIKNNA
ncbi:MAG: helix-turn-helix domain-containing protein [Bacilli bacterium]|nr:helix-turn-helix domain-containing protein [Bacilli bacterium]